VGADGDPNKTIKHVSNTRFRLSLVHSAHYWRTEVWQICKYDCFDFITTRTQNWLDSGVINCKPLPYWWWLDSCHLPIMATNKTHTTNQQRLQQFSHVPFSSLSQIAKVKESFSNFNQTVDSFRYKISLDV